MSKSLCGLFALALVACGCHEESSSGHTTQIESMNPAQYPVVSVVPVIDHTKSQYEWNLSDELSSAIYATLSQHDKVILNTSSKVRSRSIPALAAHNPFDTNLSWVKKAFTDEEFVVFLELVEHEEVFRQSRSKPIDEALCSSDLRMSMRVRVIDLRQTEPRVVLQELVHHSYAIHPQFNQVNFYQVPWKDQSFEVSPVGQAHAKFTKEISSRVEDYILLALKK